VNFVHELPWIAYIRYKSQVESGVLNLSLYS